MPRGSCLTLFADDEIDSIAQYNFIPHAKINKKAGSTKLPVHFLGKKNHEDFIVMQIAKIRKKTIAANFLSKTLASGGIILYHCKEIGASRLQKQQNQDNSRSGRCKPVKVN